jgi:hypothetical protein
MANALYDAAKEGFLGGTIDWDTDTLRAVLVDTGTYTVNLNTHRDYADLSGVVGTESGAFTSPTLTDGVADAADITFTAVTGATAEAIVIFKDTGVAANDILIAYIDTATGLPVTPNGGDITVAWDSGANRIFSL